MIFTHTKSCHTNFLVRQPLLTLCVITHIMKEYMEKYRVEFYETADGKEPAKEFVLNLNYEFRAKVIRSLKETT